MRTIEQTSRFKRDYKREAKGPHRQTLASDFVAVVTALANDQVLADKHRDHALTGDWKDHRDCHIKPDLVLIYRKPDDAVLQLVRLGSHSDAWLVSTSPPRTRTSMPISSTDEEWDELVPENFDTTALLRAVDACHRHCKNDPLTPT